MWLNGSGRSNDSGAYDGASQVRNSGFAVAPEVQAGVDGRRGRQLVGVDVVAPPAEVVVGVPGDVGRQHRQRRRGPRRGDDPGEREPRARGRTGAEVVQAAALGGRDVLRVRRAVVADLVPLHAGPGVVAVGGDLHRRARAVLVEPAEAADELRRPPVAPQLQLVRLDRVDAELAGLAAADPLGPGVAEQAVGKEPELVRRRDGHRHPASFGPEAGALQGDGVAPGGRSRCTAPVARERASHDRPRSSTNSSATSCRAE